jgi:hypothetical protein
MLCAFIICREGQNLLTNPGFENGTQNWLTQNAQLALSTNAPFTGSNTATASIPPIATPAQMTNFVYQSVLGRVEKGQTYTFGGYFRAPPSRSFALLVTIGDRHSLFTSGSTMVAPTSWTYISVQFKAASSSVTGALTRAEVSIRNPSTGNTLEIEFDDLVLSNSSPSLTIGRTNELVRVEWPRTATGYVLQTMSALLERSNWTQITSIETNATTYTHFSSISSNRFFRLMKP